ncbi:MAG: RidA family protein [Proteobacteria bacterium]|nr:RidA family protein [Pseudomonadota bacterium]
MSSSAAVRLSSDEINQRLKSMNLTLPEAKAPPGALYVPYTVSGNQVIVSGQLPFKDGALSHTGKLGKNVSQEQGQEAAKVCAINVLSCLNSAVNGNLSRVKKVLKLEVLVAVTPEFTSPQLVANGASKLFIDLFGEEIGKHARVAYGVATLPLDAAVEVAAIFEIA